MRHLVAVALATVALVGPSVLAADADAPHLLVRITNDGADTEGRVTVARGDETPFFDERIGLPGGARTLVRVDAPYDEYAVTLYLPDAVEGGPPLLLPTDPGWRATARTQDCPGGFAVDYSFELGDHFAIDGGGCLVPTPAFVALLEEARAAQPGLARASVHVPVPGSGDRGVYDHGGEMPFEWRADASWTDEWGRATRGAEVTYKNNFGSATGSGSALGYAVAVAFESMELFRYEDGAVRPSAWTRTDTRVADGATSPGAALAREVRFDATDKAASCLLRNGLQGRTIRAGDTIPADEACPLWPSAPWRAAAPIDWNDLRALPLYQLDESEDRTLVSRALLLEGIPYFAAFDSFELPADGTVIQRKSTLERLEPSGAPLAEGSPRPPPTPRLDPIDPLRGPALADPSRFAFTLAEASDAARAQIERVAQVAGSPEGALVGAIYLFDEGAGGTPLSRASWFVIYRSGAELAYAACERQTGLPITPPVRCVVPQAYAWTLYEWADAVLEPPAMTRADVPARGASFDDAFARWDATRPGGALARPTFAAYRAWDIAQEPFEPAMLAVGLAPPSDASPLARESAGDHAAMRLADGATHASVELTRTSANFDPVVIGVLGPGIVSSSPPSASVAGALPLLAGGGLALGILLLAFVLYSRLVRSRVLDDATRAAIIDVVTVEPGLHASGVRERIGKRGGVGEYHLDVLVRGGFLTSVATPGFRRYFVTGKHTPREMRVIAAMREGQNERLLGIIRAQPGIEMRMLAAEAGVSVPYVSRSVARLAEAGLVEKVQVGRSVSLHPSEA